MFGLADDGREEEIGSRLIIVVETGRIGPGAFGRGSVFAGL